MRKQKISILFSIDKDITINYTLYPIFKSKYLYNFDFFTNIEELYLKDKNSVLVILGKLFTGLSSDKKLDLIRKAKNKYKHLIFFDDLDGSEIQFFKYFDNFDLFFKKQVYGNKLNYIKDFQGDKLFTDFYSKYSGGEVIVKYGFDGKYEGNPNDLEKIKVAWNIGLGPYPPNNSKITRFFFNYLGKNFIWLVLNKFPQKEFRLKKEIKKCQARFSFNPKRDHIDFQRKLLLEIISNNSLFLSGKIDPKNYLKELKSTIAVLSPFGFGEICFRDFEAIINGAVLVKPNMDHLITWPNIYLPNQTYLPINWNGSDLIDKVENLISNPIMINELRQNAFQVLSGAHENLDDKVAEFIDLILSLK